MSSRLVAVASGDPLAPTTFSGYSRHLFEEIQRQGVGLDTVNTRDVRPFDYVSGAFNARGVLDRLAGRNASRVRPDWYWSWRGYETLVARFDARLRELPDAHAPLLQIGTHLAPSGADRDLYCVTDCTVPQAVEAGHFAVSRSSRRTVSEALEIQRHVLAASRKVFVLSEWTARSVIDDCAVPAERVVVVGAGANLTHEVDRRPDPDTPYALFVGIDWERKGGRLAVEAMREVRRQDPRVRLVVVGCSPPEGDEPGIDVVGYLRRSSTIEYQRLLELYARATCLVLLSSFDPFPNVILEAGYVGVPVVSIVGGSRREAVEPGRTGLLTPRSPQAVAEAILQLVRSPELVQRMGEAARQVVRSRFTWPQVAANVLREMGVDTPARVSPS